MSDIFQEVDEALQKEKFEKIWHDHKEKIIAAIAVLIIGSGAFSFYNSWNTKKDGADTAKLMASLEAEPNAEELTKISNETRKGVATLGSFLNAGLKLEADKPAEAVKQYEMIINKTAPSNAMEDLARVLKSQYSDDANADLKILKPVLADAKSPFHWHARLQAATIEAQSNQDFAKAIEYLDPILNTDNVSATLKQRAAALSHVYQINLNQKENNQS